MKRSYKVAYVYPGSIDTLSYREHVAWGVQRNCKVHLIGINTKNLDIPKQAVTNIEVRQSVFMRPYFFFAAAIEVIRRRCDIVVCNQARFVSLLALALRCYRRFSGRPCYLVFDIRTVSVNGRFSKVKDCLTRIESGLFDERWAISSGVACHILGDDPTVRIVGVGTSALTDTNNSPVTNEAETGRSKVVTVVYVGTLVGRRVVEFISAIAAHEANVRFLICWTDGEEEFQQLASLFSQPSLKGRCEFHYRLPYDQLSACLRRSNIGLCLLSKHPGYKHQPSTKLYDYANHGLVILATDAFGVRSQLQGISYPAAVLVGTDGVESLLSGWRQAYSLALGRARFTGEGVPTWADVASGVWTRFDEIAREIGC